MCSPPLGEEILIVQLSVSRNVRGRSGDEDDDGPSEQNNDETDDGGGDNFLRFFNVFFIASGGEPDEPAVDDEDDGDQGHKTKNEPDDVQNRLLQVSLTQTDVYRFNAEGGGGVTDDRESHSTERTSNDGELCEFIEFHSVCSPPSKVYTGYDELGVGGYIRGRSGDEDDDGPSEQNDNQPNDGGGDNPFRLFDIILVTSCGEPDEPAVDDKHDCDQGHETEDQSHDIQDRGLEVSVAETDLAPDRLNAKRSRCRVADGWHSQCRYYP